MRAWLVTWVKDTDSASIVCASSRERAKVAFWRSAQAASVAIAWCDIRAVRAKAYDALSERRGYAARPIMVQYAAQALAQGQSSGNVT